MGHNDLDKDVIEKYKMRINKLLYDINKAGLLQGEAEDILFSNVRDIESLFDGMLKDFSNIENPCKKCFVRPCCELYRYYISMENCSVFEFGWKDLSKCKPKAREFLISQIKSNSWDNDIFSDQYDIVTLISMFWF
jgi:hypothetical protein